MRARITRPWNDLSLARLLHDTPLGHRVVAFKVWGAGGRLLCNSTRASEGQVFPVHGEGGWPALGGAKAGELQPHANLVMTRPSPGSRIIDTALLDILLLLAFQRRRGPASSEG